MAAIELQQSGCNNEKTASCNEELMESEVISKRGGWITFPFIIGGVVGLTLGGAGCMGNLVVYLIQKFHVKSIDATQILNVVNGCTSVLPLLAAIIADSFTGCFSVIWISSLLSLLGIVLLALTAILHHLRPQACEMGSKLCTSPSNLQLSVLYTGIALASVGLGGVRFTLAAMGANQFESPKDQGTFINWYVITLYASAVTGGTVIVYIEDNVSWALGFGLCVATTLIGLVIFLLGRRYYRSNELQGSPFTSLARVVVAAIQKRKIPHSSKTEDYYCSRDASIGLEVSAPTRSFRFFNLAAQKTEGDTHPDGSIAKPWRLCSVQQVEDLKALIRNLPVLSSGIFLSTPIAVLSSLTILQALSVDRSLGPHFKVPAGSMIVFILTSTAVSLVFTDRLLYPLWQKLTHRSTTPLQQIGVGHMSSAVGLAVAALVESKRLKIAHNHNLIEQSGSSTVPMSILWLVPQLAVVGFGEAFHYPGQVTLYYQEFPKSLGSTATAMISITMGIAYYLSTGVIDLFRRITPWLPDDINEGRLDYVYSVMLVLGALNFCYFLICAKFYKYQRLPRGNNN